MKKKIESIFVCILLFVTVTSVTGTMNIEKGDSISLEPESISNDVVWSDNFDSYDLGQFLDGTSDDGGWKGWGDDPELGAYVVDDQFRSEPHSVEITGYVDLVHEFTDIRSGTWTFTDWVYVPSDFSGRSDIWLMSYYKPGHSFAVREQLYLCFNGDTGLVSSLSENSPSPTLPLITDQWVEIRVEIDFEADWFECYYNDELLEARNWTAGQANYYDGYHNFAAVNIFNFGGTTIYHDDLSLEGETTDPVPDLECEGGLSWTDVEPGAYVTGNFTVRNIGDPNSRLEWRIDEHPDWGIWMYHPTWGRMTPEDEPITVEITVKALDNRNKDFSGVLKVCAIGDPSDYCEIPVSLSTPRSQQFNNPLLQRILERFPNAFPILRQLLGL